MSQHPETADMPLTGIPVKRLLFLKICWKSWTLSIYFSRSWTDIWQAVTFILAVGILDAGGYWAGAIEEQWQQFIKYNCKKIGFWTQSNNLWYKIVLCLIWALLLQWSFRVFNYRMILCVCNTWALQMSVPPSLNKFPFGEQKVHLQCVHKHLEVKILLIAGFNIFTVVFWMGFRNKEQWILQDALGISICLYELKELHTPNRKAWSWFLLALSSVKSSSYWLLLH